MAFDFKKRYGELYLPPARPVLVEVPAMSFVTASGEGDPNGPAFQDAVGALYAVSFTVKMLPKKGTVPAGYYDYSVAPLEALWWLTDGGGFRFEQRENWAWTAMIRQPEFVTAELVDSLMPQIKKKKPNPAMDMIKLECFTEGPCVQMMHIGPYAGEPETLQRMTAFMLENGLTDLVGLGGKHHEIYLSDPRKASPERMRTVLRHPVRRGA
jgi:hypothetical protein